jgi:DNA (cytosine-5)-methyltransferase 1
VTTNAHQLPLLTELVSLEICAGAGGQALGLEAAGFHHVAAVELDDSCVATLEHNRPAWNPIKKDVRTINGRDYRGIDLFAGGVPCPPFSIAGKQLGADDERDLFPAALDLIADCEPRAVLLENVRGLAVGRFTNYRESIARQLRKMGLEPQWQVLNACNYGVPQLRPRFVLIALRRKYASTFEWPNAIGTPPTVGETLADLMKSRGWRGAANWVSLADGIAPTLVGGSKKHGGPDLGPSRAKQQWAKLGVNGHGLADEAPGREFPANAMPKLTVRMAARIQGFPDDWFITGRKTAAYRQVGNAFPPPVAEALGHSIREAILGSRALRIQPSKTRKRA